MEGMEEEPGLSLGGDSMPSLMGAMMEGPQGMVPVQQVHSNHYTLQGQGLQGMSGLASQSHPVALAGQFGGTDSMGSTGITSNMGMSSGVCEANQWWS